MLDLIQKLSSPFVRNAIQHLAGILVGAGLLTQDQSAQFVELGLALVLGAIAYGMSKLNEHTQEKSKEAVIKVALKEPTPPVITKDHIDAVKEKAERLVA